MSNLDSQPRSDARQTILYIHHGWGLGGAPVSLLQLAQALDPVHYRPVIICLQNGSAAQLFREQRLETVVCPQIQSFAHTTGGWYPLHTPRGLWQFIRHTVAFLPSARRTLALIQQYQPVLVHLNSLSLAPSALAAHWARTPLVWHVREIVHPGHLGIRWQVFTWMLERLPDEVIYICRDGQERLTGRRKGVVVYNSVDFREFDRNLSGHPLRQELGLDPTDRVVLHLGGFRPIKGTWELVQAIARARHQVPNLRCIIAGCPPEREGWWVSLANRLGYYGYGQRIRRFIQEQGLEQTILLQPFRSDVPRLIAAADLLVFPSLTPHFARPVMEAGAMAKPVIASHVGGVNEIVEDNVTGRLVPPGDVEALAAAIVQVLSDASCAARLGEAAFRQARRLFDARENLRLMLEVYECLLDERL